MTIPHRPMSDLRPTSSPARRRALTGLTLAAATFASLAALPAVAQDAWPSRPIKFIVPFPPGGGTDMIARTVAQQIEQQTKWTVVVENKAGAGGNLGVDAAAKAAPDGYTIVIGQTSNLAINPALHTKLPYDPLKDLQPVALVSASPIVMAVAANSPFKTFADVVKAAKAKPDHVTLGFSGNGTVAHLASVQASKAAGIELRNVPYRGASQAMTDLLGGNIDLYMSSVPTLLGGVRKGQLRAIVTTGATRSSQLPDTPTLAESGLKDFESVTWFGVLAPAGTPQPIVQKLNAAVNDALKVPEVADKLKGEGGNVLGGTSEQFTKLLQAELPRWAEIVKASGAKVD
jgi:tripartite-type tricarboxylate transporter receptor subunit TctC